MNTSLKPRDAAGKNIPAETVSVARRVMNAIRKLQGKEGISLPDLKKYLRDARKMDLGIHNAEINLALKNGVDRGILLRESGNYKVREAKRRRSRSRSGKRRSRRRSGGRKRSRSRRRSGSKRRRSRRRKKAAEGEAC